MATKTISIKEEVYNKLLAMKRDNESFSDFLNRLAESQKSDNLLKQLQGSIDIEDSQELIDEIKLRREDWRG